MEDGGAVWRLAAPIPKATLLRSGAGADEEVDGEQ